MDKEDLKALNRARVTAGWSYLGALVPLVGWILGAISLSNLGSIDTPDTSKAKRRIQSVKKLAIGGIILSTVIALAYGGATYWSVKNNAKEALQAQQQDCNNQVSAYNTKILALPGAQIPDIAPLTGCAKGDYQGAISGAKSAYQSAVSRGQQRCLNTAQDSYTQYLKINATRTSTDSNGQTVYYMPQPNWDYVNKVLQQDKDNCYQQFPTT